MLEAELPPEYNHSISTRNSCASKARENPSSDSKLSILAAFQAETPLISMFRFPEPALCN